MKKVILLVFLLVLVSVVFGQQQRFYGVGVGGDPCEELRLRITNYESQLEQFNGREDLSLAEKEEKNNLELGLADTKKRLRRCESSKSEAPPEKTSSVQIQTTTNLPASKVMTTEEWHDWIIPVYKNIDRVACSDLQNKIGELYNMFTSQSEGTIKDQMNKEIANLERKSRELFPDGCEAQTEQPPAQQPPVSIDPFLNEGGFLACSCEGPTQEEYRTGSGNVQKIKRGNAIRIHCDFYEMSTFESGDKTMVQFFGPNPLASDESYSFSFNENELSSEGHICGCNDLSNALNGLNNPKFQLMSSSPDGNYVPISRNDVEAHEEGVNNDKRGKKMGDARNKQRMDLEQKIGSALAVISPTPCEGRETGFRTPTLIPTDALSKQETQVAIGLPSDNLMPDPNTVAFCVSGNKERDEINKKIAALEEQASELRSLSTPSSITTAVTVTGLQTASLEKTQEQLRQFNEQIAALQRQLDALQQQNCDKEVFTRDLTIGSSGNDVIKLQEYLGVPTSGYFGPLTKSAVQKYQQDNNILQTPTGIFGPKTRAKLNELSASSSQQVNLGETLANTLTNPSSTSISVSVSSDISSGGRSYCRDYVDGRVEAGFNTDQGFIVKTFPTCAGRVALKATCIQNIMALEGQQVAEITQEICGEDQYCLEGACSDRPSEPSTEGISITCPIDKSNTFVLKQVHFTFASAGEPVSTVGEYFTNVKLYEDNQEVCSCTPKTVPDGSPEFDLLNDFIVNAESTKTVKVSVDDTSDESQPASSESPALSPKLQEILKQMLKIKFSENGQCDARPTTGTWSEPGYIDVTSKAQEAYPNCKQVDGGVIMYYSTKSLDFSFTPNSPSLCHACPTPLTVVDVNGFVRVQDPVQVDCGQRPTTGTSQTPIADWTSVIGACSVPKINKGCRTSGQECTCPPETGTSQPVDTTPGAVCPSDCRDMGESDGKKLCNCCGNGRIDTNTASSNYLTVYEKCDGNNFGGATCSTEKGSGYEGSLSCNIITCQTIDSSACAKRPETGTSQPPSNACGVKESKWYYSYSTQSNSFETVTQSCVVVDANGNSIPYTDGRSCFPGCDDSECLGCVMRIVSPPFCNWETGVCDPNPADDILKTDPSWTGVLVADASTDNTGTGGTEGTGSGSGGSGIGGAVVYSRNYCYWGVFWNSRTQRMECI